jgi:opacity protein-like surface antigen
MRRFVVSAAFAVSVFAAESALADDLGGLQGLYLGGKAGVSFEGVDNLKNTSPVANPAAVNVTSQSNTVGAFGANIGYNFKRLGAPIRAEVEYTYRTDFDYSPNPVFSNAGVASSLNSTLNSHTVMVNAYYDIDTKTKFTPYVGGGLGVAINQTSSTLSVAGVSGSKDNSQTNFAWSLGAGIGYALDSNWTAELGYRYIDLGKAVYGGSVVSVTSDSVTAHEVTAGIRYQF